MLSALRPTLTKFGAIVRTPANAIGPPLDLNPVLWREWHRNRASRWSRIIGTLYVALAMIFSLIAALSGNSFSPAWVNGLQVSIGLLAPERFCGNLAGRGAGARQP